ncbi:hypothetical protein OIU76_007082 [Salix suchowensis]|nr:hypothetical protein OIU76_007082 [Salix suchowensis]
MATCASYHTLEQIATAKSGGERIIYNILCYPTSISFLQHSQQILCDIGSVTNGSCNGIGCCQIPIPGNLLNYNASVFSFKNHTDIWESNPCGFAFLAEEESFNFTIANLTSIKNTTLLPSSIDWAIGNQTCEEAKKNLTGYVCKANSDCYDSSNAPGYLCNCSTGYIGNPYIPDGCQGNFTCPCPKGYHGDGRKDGEGCSADQLLAVKIFVGCCLETEVPLLVYECISNGTLSSYIHDRSKAATFTWETRLRIAADTAGVLSYLHSAASMPIIHRDVKSNNILLDENHTAKVSDFGSSRLVPLDQAQISTMVQGTLGYLDPEYLLTSQLTEKSDVYSFGVVLVELLTGKRPLCFDGPEEERSLAMLFLSALKEDRLFQILEDCIAKEGNVEQVDKVARLVKTCLRVKGEERPTMKEVAMELERLRMVGKHPWINVESNYEETEYLLGKKIDASGHGKSGESSSGYQVIGPVLLPSGGR